MVVTQQFAMLGDSHGELSSLNDWLSNHRELPGISVGDLSLYGYKEISDRVTAAGTKLFFVEGNHEAFPVLNPDGTFPCEILPNVIHIPRGYISGYTLFFGGADSIDKRSRIEGVSWFPQESVTYSQVLRVIDRLDKMKPSELPTTVVAHTLPYTPAVLEVCSRVGGNKHDTPTEKVLQGLFDELHPRRWYFGHWHIDVDFVWQRCEFHCLDATIPAGPYARIGRTLLVDLHVDEKFLTQYQQVRVSDK